jgi:hypothetical protein
MVNFWKHLLCESAADIFDKNQKTRTQSEEQIDELYLQIGQLEVGGIFYPKSSVSKP